MVQVGDRLARGHAEQAVADGSAEQGREDVDGTGGVPETTLQPLQRRCMAPRQGVEAGMNAPERLAVRGQHQQVGGQEGPKFRDRRQPVAERIGSGWRYIRQ